MATEEGVVTRAGSGTAWVKTSKSSSCEACSSRKSCNVMGGGKEMEVEAVNTAGAKAGDTVVISFQAASLLKAAFLIHIFPIMCLVAGAVTGEKIAPSINFSTSAASVITGFIFFFISFVIVRIVGNRMAKKDQYRPSIIRVKRKRKV